MPNLIGRTFGHLTVTRQIDAHPPTWECVCECGTVRISRTKPLTRRGGIRHCGCKTKERQRHASTRHGLSQSTEHAIWRGMRSRCLIPSAGNYVNYGGRGITVCERWNTFENFLTDMGLRPSPSHSIERINNDGPYCPDNCRWATASEQHRNTRRTKWIEFEGQTRSLAEWAELRQIADTTIDERLKRGWSLKRALNTPV